MQEPVSTKEETATSGNVIVYDTPECPLAPYLIPASEEDGQEVSPLPLHQETRSPPHLYETFVVELLSPREEPEEEVEEVVRMTPVEESGYGCVEEEVAEEYGRGSEDKGADHGVRPQSNPSPDPASLLIFPTLRSVTC